MTKESFFDLLSNEVKSYKGFLETDSKDWIVKGFIDIDKNVYTITNDTKVVSKIIEILLIPKLERFARNNGMTLELPSKQNFYPDLTFKDEEGHLFAVDFKSSYYDGNSVNGLTLAHIGGISENETPSRTWIILTIHIPHTLSLVCFTNKVMWAVTRGKSTL